MPLDNSLNVAELLRRLGIKGDSLGSMPLLESLRLTLSIGDFSQLMSPLAGPIGGADIASVSAAGTMNKWSLQCQAVGGLKVSSLKFSNNLFYDVWITGVNPFGAITGGPIVHDYSFGRFAQSSFTSHTPAAKVAPVGVVRVQPWILSVLISDFPNWVGPGEFLNIENTTNNNSANVAIMWQEYTAGLNP